MEAMARCLQRPIEVIQANGLQFVAGASHLGTEAGEDTPHLIVSYHRHAFGSGEHYNSVILLESQ